MNQEQVNEATIQLYRDIVKIAARHNIINGYNTDGTLQFYLNNAGDYLQGLIIEMREAKNLAMQYNGDTPFRNEDE